MTEQLSLSNQTWDTNYTSSPCCEHRWYTLKMSRRDNFNGPRPHRLPAGSHLKLLPTRGAQEVLAVRVPEHMQTQLVRTAEGLVALCTLVDLFWVEAAHVLLHLAEKTQKVRENDRRQLANTRGSQMHCLGFSSGLGANRVWLITGLSNSLLFMVARKPYQPRPPRTWEEEENACLVQALITWATFVSLPL